MGKRSLDHEGKKLNLVKVCFAIILLVLVVISVIYLVKTINKSNIEEIKDISKENIVNQEYNTVEIPKIENNIEKIASDFGGQIIEKPKADTYYIAKDGVNYTAYSDGEIVQGTVIPWDGKEAKPAVDEAGNINIYSAAELAWVANRVISGEKNFNGVTITLRSNIDLGGRKTEDGSWEGPLWNSIIGFLEGEANQLGDVAKETLEEDLDIKNENLKRFAGAFNGNGCWIRGMRIDTQKRYQGLFGYQSGVISNLTIKYSDVKAGESSGILVGLNEGKIKNCRVENSSITSNEKTGGLVGIAMTNSIVEDCKIDKFSNVSGKKNIGGLIGYINNNVTIQNLTNESTVKGDEYIGGIAGVSFYGTTFKNLNSNGKTEGKLYVGGLVGYSQTDVENSVNNGLVVGEKYVGGLVGLNHEMGNVIDSINNGNIKVFNENAGGIVGINNGSITSCYNTGEIDSTQTDKLTIGGICGQNLSDSFINTSYNIGKIRNQNYAGGVVGADFGSITNCFCLNTCLEKDTEDTDYKTTEEEMKNNIIFKLGNDYKTDEENKNNGYPILKWQ